MKDYNFPDMFYEIHIIITVGTRYSCTWSWQISLPNTEMNSEINSFKSESIFIAELESNL